MATFQLRLTPRTNPPRAAEAWYIASSDSADWLAEVASWPTDHARVSIVPLPRDQQDLAPVGALLIPPVAHIVASRQCTPFARIAANAFIPADADLFPPLEPNELAELFAGDYVHIWRPGAGLTAAESTEAVSPQALIARGPRRPRHWNRAEPGVAFPDRLIAIAPIAKIDLRELLESGRDDIGADAEHVDDIDPSPDESKLGPLGAAGRIAAITALGALAALARLIPKLPAKANKQPGKGARGAASGTRAGASAGSGKIGKLLKEQLARIGRSLSAARHRELNRLLHMLDNDPDKGLRFALPFSAAMHRGQARPSGRLGERMIDFSLRRLGGGGPADVWDVSAEYQRRLQEKYRELANREIRLNRHRRAAYIFAELLGDYFSAAAALRDGKHYREAAVVYRDKLKRPQEAAKCFEDGGLWSEAIAEYQQLQMYEKIGDLYTHLEDAARAAEAYRTTSEAFRSRSDYLSAARICEEKLRDADHAALDLETGWLNSAQSTQCMQALFSLLGRQGQHVAARERAGELVVEAAELSRHIAISGMLADVASNYPDVGVREAAAEDALQVIGSRLPGANPGEAEALCNVLARLAPEDRLLTRDARRYVTRAQQRSAAPIKGARRALAAIKVINQWSFGLRGAWRTAVVADDTLFAVGIVDSRVVLSRSTLNGHVDSFVSPWSKTPVRSDVRLLVVADPKRADHLVVYAVGEPPLNSHIVYPASDRFATSLSAGSDFRVPTAYGAARDADGQTWIIDNREGGTVSVIGDSYTLIATHRLPLRAASGNSDLVFPIPMLARGGRLYVGLSSTLVTMEGSQVIETQELPSSIGALAGTAPHTLNRIAVSLEVGACLSWDGAGHHQTRAFAEDMAQPVVGFNRGGCVIAASGPRFEVYDTKHGKLTLIAAESLPRSTVIAVFALPEPNRFGLVDADGNAFVYELGRLS